MDFGGAPLEGSGGFQVGGYESVDGGAQFAYVAEAGSLERPAGEQAEPDLDLIEPRSMGGSEVKVDIIESRI